MGSFLNIDPNFPLIGPWARKIGQVTKLMATPCSISPKIWIEAFFVAEAKLIFSFVKPQLLLDKFAKGSPLVRHITEGIGKREPPGPFPGHVGLHGDGWEELFGTHVGDAGPALIIVDIFEFLLKLQWWFFVVDVGVDMAVNWSSMAYEWAGCTGTPGDYCDQDDNILQVVSPSGGWSRVLFGYTAGNHRYADGHGALVPRAGNGGGGVGASFGPWPVVPHPVGGLEARVVNSSTGDILREMPVQHYKAGANNAVGGLFHFPQSGGSGLDLIELHVRAHGGFVEISHPTSHMHVGGDMNRGILPANWGSVESIPH